MYQLRQLKTIQKENIGHINVLLKQLSQSSKNITLATLRAIAGNNGVEIWVIKDKKKIIGMATLVIVTIPTATFARVEDVVVSSEYRGKGLGKKLSEKLIARAKTRKAAFIDLTSRPERVAANTLYQKLGFKKRETNVYRLSL